MKYFIQIIFLFIAMQYRVPLAYATPSLNGFISQISETNPAIQAAKLNVSAAEAREHAATQPLYNPELTAERQTAIENVTSIGINQTIDWVNKRKARSWVGTSNVWVARAELINLRNQFLFQVLTALAKYQTQQQTVTLAKKRSSLLKHFLVLTQKRYANGDIARVDLDLAQLAYAEAIAQEADAEVNANQALQILRASTGFNHFSFPQLAAALPRPELNVDIDKLMEKSPPLRIMHQQYKTALARVKLAERERYPDPTFGIQGGESSDGHKHRRLIGFTFNLPLPIRNSYRAEVDAANFDAIEAEEKMADIVRQTRAEISSTAERYQVLYRAMEHWQSASGKSLHDGMLLIERLWRSGEMSTTEYLVQLKQRIDSQISGVVLKGHAWEGWMEWLKASGQIEGWLDLTPTEECL